MFFRRHKAAVQTFSDWMNKLSSAGFRVEATSPGRAKVLRGSVAGLVEEAGDGACRIGDVGIAMGSEIAVLTDKGNQKIFRTDSGKMAAAQAEHLHALHAFVEDLREQLGLTSLYNESLGTTNERHLYDRVQNRDAGVPTRPWERKA